MKRLQSFGLVASSVALTVSADQPRDLPTLFPRQAPIVADNGGFSRLVLSPEVLATCRDDLSDLRVFDSEDNEVPYLVDGGLRPDDVVEVTQRFTPELLAVDRRRIDRETGPSLWEESYELRVPDERPITGRWDLVIVADAPEFVRRLRVDRVMDDGALDNVVARESVFRLAGPRRERTAVTLPEVATDRLVITLEGEDGFYLNPVLRFENTRTISPAESAIVDLVELDRHRSDGRTVVELARPRGLVPDMLVAETTTPAFNRRIEVWDDGQGAANSVLGDHVVFRVPAVAAVENTELSIAAPHGDRLRVIVFDGDSPELENLAFQAVVRRPALIFNLPKPFPGQSAGVLRFGGGRAFTPRYDLASPPGVSGERGFESATVIEDLSESVKLAVAVLGPITANPAFDPAPALAFAQRPGAELDRETFSHRRRVSATPSPEGLSRLALAPEDLAVLAPDLADLRIVDQSSRQWAYLLEGKAVDSGRELVVEPPSTENGVTRYRFELPVTPMTVDRLVIDAPAPFFDRAFSLAAAVDEKGKRVVSLASGRLVRRVGDPRPVTIPVPATRIYSLELEVVDGGDSPLVLSSVSLRFPVPELYFAAPAGEYELLLGHPGASAPRYELERIRPMVLAVESSNAVVQPLEANPDFRPGARAANRAGALQLVLWIVVIALVVFLTALTLKLAREKPGP
jgi:hypothetical protein